jgi:hypothetical protein
LSLIAELRQLLEGQLESHSGVTCELMPYRLTIRYRGQNVGWWQATREGARWHGANEQDIEAHVTRDVFDALASGLSAPGCSAALGARYCFQLMDTILNP